MGVDLLDNEFRLELAYKWLGGERLRLDVESVFPLDGVMLAVAMREADEKPPVPMNALGEDGLRWSLEIRLPQPDTDRVRLVASSGGTKYFGEFSTKFTLVADNTD